MNKLIFTFLLIVTFTVKAQTTPDVIFKNLKNGAVLVRLKTNSNTINALKGNNDELMKRIIAKRDERNKEIIDAFESQFEFCRVFYFYSDSSESIAKGNFKGVLLDDELNTIEIIPKLKDNYLIMEFSNIMQDASRVWSYSDWGVRDGKAQKIDYYSGGNEKGPNALIILMPNFKLVPNKYPYFVKTYEGLPFVEKSKAKIVKEMQYKILRLY